MQSDSERIRQMLFEKYSANWKLIFPYTSFYNDPRLQHVEIMCPLCLTCFTRDGLDQKYEDALTLEHIPPKNVGGSVGILLCRKCNSNTGAIDNKLLTQRNYNSFTIGELNSQHTGVLIFDKNYFPAIVTRRDRGLDFEIQNIENVYKIKTLLQNGGSMKFNFNHYSKEWESQLAHLKIAYLFGYSFILNTTYNKIRNQILRPKEEILPVVTTSSHVEGDRKEGVYFISEPIELRSIFVIFKIKLKNKIELRGVNLPPHGTDPEMFYELLSSFKGTIKYTKYEEPPNFNYLEENPFTFFANLWEHYLNRVDKTT